jgi:hypothetical protein
MHVTDYLLQLEASLLSSAVRADYDELNRLIANDFIEVGASGRALEKQTFCFGYLPSMVHPLTRST